MIVIKNKDYFRKVWREAKARGLHLQLRSWLRYLRTYGCHKDPRRTRCLLQYDWAPLSFGFLMTIRNDQTGEYEPWFNGGLIWREHEKQWGVHT